MPVGPYNTRASNKQWNPGLPDMPEKTRLNVVNLLAKEQASLKHQVASSSTKRTSDPEPNNVATPTLSRPKPRGIFSKAKSTGLPVVDAELSQVTRQFEANFDTEMSDSTNFGAKIDSNDNHHLNNTEFETEGVQVEQRAKKLRRLRRAVSEEAAVTSTVKRKGAADLDGRPAKKPNSAPHRSNLRTSSIPSSGAYDDWRDRANLTKHLALQHPRHQQPNGSKSSANSGTTAPSHTGISVKERNSNVEDHDVSEPVTSGQNESESASPKSPDADPSDDGPDTNGVLASDALGHGLIVSGSEAPNKFPPPSKASSQQSRKSMKHNNEPHESEAPSKSPPPSKAASQQSRKSMKHGNEPHGLDLVEENHQTHKPLGTEDFEEPSNMTPKHPVRDKNTPNKPRLPSSTASSEKSTRHDHENHQSDFNEEEEEPDYRDYVSCSDDYEDEPKAKKPANNKPKVWINVDEELEGSEENQQGDEDETPPVVKGAGGCNTKPGPSIVHVSDSEPQSSGPPFPPLAQRRRQSPAPSTVNSQRTSQRRYTPAPMSNTGQARGQRIRPGNGRAARGLARNQYRNSTVTTNDPDSQVAHPRANSHTHDDGEEDLAETNTGQQRFKIQDLPLSAKGVQKWSAVLVPLWIDHVFSVSENPWQPGDIADQAQIAWDNVFQRRIEHKVAARGEPVYYLLRQRVYEFRGRMADRAEHAVETFFDSFHEDNQSQETRAEYVEWAVPCDEIESDRFGNRSAVHRPKHMPFLWKRSPGDSDDDEDRGEGPFQHQMILDTFAFFIENVDHLPPDLRSIARGRYPCAALALAAAAVERALCLWRTGNYTPFIKPQLRFDQRKWGFHTAEYMKSVQKLSDENWEKILNGAQAYKFNYSSPDYYIRNYVNSKMDGQSSGRATCY